MFQHFRDGSKKIAKAHLKGVSDLVLLPNGVLASSGFEGSVKLWDIKSGICIRTLYDQLNCSPNFAIVDLNRDSQVATSTMHGLMRWEYLPVHFQRFGLKVNEVRHLRGHAGRVCALIRYKNNPYEDCLISGGSDQTIKLWDKNTGKFLITLTGHSGEVMSLAELNGGLVASGARDKTIKIWDLKTGECVRTLEGHEGCVYSFALLGENLLASASGDHTIRIWDLNKGECIKVLREHTDIVTRLVLLQDGLLASCSMDCYVKLWDVTSIKDTHFVESLGRFYSGVRALTQLKDGSLAVGIESSIQIIPLPSRRPMNVSTEVVPPVSLSEVSIEMHATSPITQPRVPSKKRKVSTTTQPDAPSKKPKVLTTNSGHTLVCTRAQRKKTHEEQREMTGSEWLNMR